MKYILILILFVELLFTQSITVNRKWYWDNLNKISEDYVFLEDSTGYVDTNYDITQVTSGGEFAIEVDIQPGVLSTISYIFGVLASNGGGEFSAIQLDILISGQLELLCLVHSSTGATSTIDPVFTPAAPERKKIKICFIENSADGIKIYADDIEQPLTIAVNTSDFSNFDFSIYNELFLNAINQQSLYISEISNNYYKYTLYSDTAATTKVQEFLINEGIGTTLNDNIGSSNGTIIGDYQWY